MAVSFARRWHLSRVTPILAVGALHLAVGFGCTTGGGGTDSGADAAPDAAVDAPQRPDGYVPPVDCAAQAVWIYLVDADSRLVRFLPGTQTTELVGTLNCDSRGRPLSMAVDRNAVAWVRWGEVPSTSSQLFRVSTDDASCEPSGLTSGDLGLTSFGMGFVAAAAGSATESLYLVGLPSPTATAAEVGTLDLSAKTYTRVGPFAGRLEAEVTGNSRGELFTLEVVMAAPPVLRRHALADAAVLEQHDFPTLPSATRHAVAFWGGAFWLFLNSKIYRYVPGSDEPTLITLDSGYQVVGAGVSTCAPADLI